MTLGNFIAEFSTKGHTDLLAEILRLSSIANHNNKLLLVQGGFAVDFAYRKLTREHGDRFNNIGIGSNIFF